jgi:hypothetical protein
LRDLHGGSTIVSTSRITSTRVLTISRVQCRAGSRTKMENASSPLPRKDRFTHAPRAPRARLYAAITHFDDDSLLLCDSCPQHGAGNTMLVSLMINRVYIMRSRDETRLCSESARIRIKRLRSVRGGELTGREFTKFLQEQGTNRLTTPRHPPTQRHRRVTQSQACRACEHDGGPKSAARSTIVYYNLQQLDMSNPTILQILLLCSSWTVRNADMIDTVHSVELHKAMRKIRPSALCFSLQASSWAKRNWMPFPCRT